LLYNSSPMFKHLLKTLARGMPKQGTKTCKYGAEGLATYTSYTVGPRLQPSTKCIHVTPVTASTFWVLLLAEHHAPVAAMGPSLLGIVGIGCLFTRRNSVQSLQ